MKSNRGVTLTSLIIYIIGLVIMVGIMAGFVGYFNKNISNIVIKDNAEEQYSKLISYISRDTNSKNLSMVKAGYNESVDKDYIIFKYKDGTQHQYIYQNKNVYYLDINNAGNKKVILCQKVSMNSNKFFDYKNGVLSLNFSINKNDYLATFNVKLQD